MITRGSNTYGPFQHPEKVIPLFVTNALEDEPLPLYGDGLQQRDWLFVDDHADAVGHVLDHGGAARRTTCRARAICTNREVTAAILERLDKPWSLVRSVPDRPGHDARYAMDGSKLAALGWRPTVFVRGRPGRHDRLVPRQRRLVARSQVRRMGRLLRRPVRVAAGRLRRGLSVAALGLGGGHRRQMGGSGGPSSMS